MCAILVDGGGEKCAAQCKNGEETYPHHSKGCEVASEARA
jgi:hypothetical protein